MSASITNTSDRSTSASGNDVPLRPCKKMESLVILDTETTCLPSPGKRPKITELCFLSILTDEILTQGQVPRVVSKLTLCFNPRQAIDPGASKVTGLFNDTLEKMETFQKQASLITSFLACLPRPLCLIAHNGLHFDFPLLVAELLNASSDGVLGLSSGIFCADSLEAFRMFDGLPAQPEWRMKKQEKESKLRRQPPPHNCALAVMGASEECTKRSAEKFMEKDSTCSDTSNPKILKLDMPTESITTTSSSLVEAEADMKWSQVSITDSQLVTGCTIVSETEELKQNISNTETKSDGWEHCETTPCRQFSLSSANVAEQFQKKEGAISVSMAEKERVSRRLFNEEQRGELQATANFSPDEGKHPNVRCSSSSSLLSVTVSTALEMSAVLSESQELSSQESIPDGDFLRIVQEIEATLFGEGSDSVQVIPSFIPISSCFVSNDIPRENVTTPSLPSLHKSSIVAHTRSCLVASPSCNVSFAFPFSGQHRNCAVGSSSVISPCLKPAFLQRTVGKNSCPQNRAISNQLNCSNQPKEFSFSHNLSDHNVQYLSRKGNNLTNNKQELEERSFQISSLYSANINSRENVIGSALPVCPMSNNTFTVNSSKVHSFINSCMPKKSPTSNCLLNSGIFLSSATDRAELSSRRNESLDVTATPYMSYRLGHIYRRVFGKLPDIAHTAEDDCNTLLKLILHRSKDFLAWVERHAIPLESVQPMY